MENFHSEFNLNIFRHKYGILYLAHFVRSSQDKVFWNISSDF